MFLMFLAIVIGLLALAYKTSGFFHHNRKPMTFVIFLCYLMVLLLVVRTLFFTT